MEELDFHITSLIEIFRISANQLTDMHLRCTVNNLENRTVRIYDDARRARRQGAFAESEGSDFFKQFNLDVGAK